jgi:hypothetical protein
MISLISVKVCFKCSEVVDSASPFLLPFNPVWDSEEMYCDHISYVVSFGFSRSLVSICLVSLLGQAKGSELMCAALHPTTETERIYFHLKSQILR